jgi:hypothetical protein
MRRIALTAAGLALMLRSTTFDVTAGECDDRYPWLCDGTNTASPPQAQQSTGTQETKGHPPARPKLRNKTSTEITGVKKDVSLQQDPRFIARLKHQFEEFLTERERRPVGDRSTDRPEDKEALFREFVQWRKNRLSSRSR